MKLLAISQRIDFIKKRNEFRDSIDQRLLEFVQDAGYLVFPVPNTFFLKKNSRIESEMILNLWLSSISPDGIILSGGNDLGSYIQRDFTEYELLKYAEKNLLPVLGICRGMQIMGNFAGVNLTRVKGHIRTRHKIIGKLDREVNSYHKKSLEKCPNNYEVIYKSEDNVIEAIRHNVLPWEGWMWHPEREFPIQDFDKIRFKSLFK